MIDPTLIEKFWSEAHIHESYLAEIRRVCTLTTSSGSLAALPELFCELHGGHQQQVIPVLTAWTILRYAARLLDDVEDGDTTATKRTDLNVSTGLIFTAGMALNTLESCGVSTTAASDIRQFFYQELLKICGGQHLDLTLKTPSLDMCWEIMAAKTGTFMGLICWAGGRVACSDNQQLKLYRQFGHTLGLLDQIRDDLADLWPNGTRQSDLHRLHYWNLPTAYALSVLPVDQKEWLLTYLGCAYPLPEEEETARELIIKSGAGVYLTIQSKLYYQQGLQLLEQMNLPAKAYHELAALLNKAQLSVKEK